MCIRDREYPCSDFRVEVTLQQALEAAARTGLILGHLVDGVVDSVEVQSLSLLGPIRRTPAATELSDTIFIIPMFPVAATCVPPQNSMEEPNWMTRPPVISRNQQSP